jgi:hypothetical protein
LRMDTFTHKPTKRVVILNSCGKVSIIAANTVLYIGTRVISVVLSLNKHFLKTNTSLSRNVVTSQRTCLSRHAQINASRERERETEHTLCLWVRHVCNCFYVMQVPCLLSLLLWRGVRTRRPSHRDHFWSVLCLRLICTHS